MIMPLKDESGFALVHVLVINLILTLTLGILLSFIAAHRRLILRKENSLHTRYLAESGLQQALHFLEQNQSLRRWERDFEFWVSTTHRDSAHIRIWPWGCFIQLTVKAQKKQQSFQIRAKIGNRLTDAFRPAIILNPAYPTLVLSEGTSILGDIVTGHEGIKSSSLPGKKLRIKPQFNGLNIKSRQDLRPGIDHNLLEAVYQEYSNVMLAGTPHSLREFLGHTAKGVDAGDLALPGSVILYATPSDLNRNELRIRGPLTLICTEKLVLDQALHLENQVRLFSSQSIIMDGAGIYDDVILYSPEPVELIKSAEFIGQIFSETGITIGADTRLDYPSTLVVRARTDTAEIHLHPRSRIWGSVIYAAEPGKFPALQNRGRIIIDHEAVVNGLVYSEIYTTLMGEVNGMIITDRFYYYHPPTAYLNWIFRGTVNRSTLTENFQLPVFFNEGFTNLTPLEYR